MKIKHHLNHLNLALIVGSLALPLITQAGQPSATPHSRYKLIDLGTLLGGPSSGVSGDSPVLNNRGTVVGGADTLNPDPFDPACFGPNCLVQHAFQWHRGTRTDLGALPGGGSSFAFWVNDTGESVGASQNGLIDPLTGTPEQLAVLWQNGEIINLGTLGGSGSQANAINNRGQVIGLAQNAVPDPFSLIGLGTQTRAFLWENGVMTDLGNLGKTSFAHGNNSGGQIVGASRVSFVTGEVRAFLWENGGPMIDLNTLVPANSSLHLAFALSINERGEIAGYGFLPNGDEHPFLLIPVGEE